MKNSGLRSVRGGFATAIRTLFFLFVTLPAVAQDSVGPFAKGNWHSGITINVDASNDDSLDTVLFDIQKNRDNGFAFTVLGGYFFKDNVSTGFQYEYAHSKVDLVYLKDADTARYRSASVDHLFTLFIRNYIPISNNGRFNFFNETDLGVGVGNAISRHNKSLEDIEKRFTDSYSLRLGIKPGVAIIIIQGFSFETSVDLLGMTYRHRNIEINGAGQGGSSDFKLDFDVSLLSLEFGLAYYF